MSPVILYHESHSSATCRQPRFQHHQELLKTTAPSGFGLPLDSPAIKSPLDIVKARELLPSLSPVSVGAYAHLITAVKVHRQPNSEVHFS